MNENMSSFCLAEQTNKVAEGCIDLLMRYVADSLQEKVTCLQAVAEAALELVEAMKHDLLYYDEWQATLDALRKVGLDITVD